MEHLLPTYNDPLFSILLIIVLGLIIALATYGWGIYKQQKEQGNLLKFLDKFDTTECSLDTNAMSYEAHMFKPLSLLAKAFENAGEYPKAISIYLYIIKSINDDFTKAELLARLANTYMHAGFLERSKNIYLDILRHSPRNVKVLYALGIVYEMMHEYENAKDVLEPLKLLGEDILSLTLFLDFAQITQDKQASSTQKIAQYKALLAKEPKFYREVVSVCLKLDTKVAWEIIDTSRLKEVLDILWFLPNSQLDLDIIQNDKGLNTLYYAKGYIPAPMLPIGEHSIFALDMMATAKQNGFEKADLHFSYLCNICKHHFPVSFKRCPNCMAIHSIEVEENIGKAHPKTNYSLL